MMMNGLAKPIYATILSTTVQHFGTYCEKSARDFAEANTASLVKATASGTPASDAGGKSNIALRAFSHAMAALLTSTAAPVDEVKLRNPCGTPGATVKSIGWPRRFNRRAKSTCDGGKSFGNRAYSAIYHALLLSNFSISKQNKRGFLIHTASSRRGSNVAATI
jgi:hypothetical protein